MATAAPHVKLLRQLASAKDDYLSGAFDISWDGAKATLYLVFGRPSHAVFETDQAQIEGEAAIDALLAALPRVFTVSDWRRAMSPHETLSITIDELAGPFVRLAGSYADDPVTEESPEWWSAVDDSPDLPFGLADFPLMPGGRPLWIETSPDEVHLSDRLADLPPSILILTGAKLRAAAVVSGGDLIDAVWIDADDHARGESAGLALLGATKGSLAGYALDDPRVAEALTMLWRLPVAVSGVELSWLDPASMLAAFRADGLDRVLVIDAPVRGIALFSRGGLVAVYSETQRSAVASPERLRSLLSQARGRLTVMERKPRPLAADASSQPASARDYFEVASPEPVGAEPVAPSATADAVEAGAAEPLVAEVDADGPVADLTAATGTTESSELEATMPDAPVEADFEPPPPPPDEEASGAAAGAPPPPAPEAAKPEHKQKRSRWGFGRSRKSRAERHAAEEAAASSIDASIQSADSEAAAFAGWSVRQPNADPQPVWQRSQDTAAAPPPPDDEAGQAGETVPTWSLAQPTDETAASAESGPDDEALPTWSLAPPADEPAAGAEAPVADENAAPTDIPISEESPAPGDVPATDEGEPPVAETNDQPVDAWVGESATAATEPFFAFTTSAAGEDAAAPPAASEPGVASGWADEGSTDAPEDPAADRDEHSQSFEFNSLDETAPDAAPEVAADPWRSTSWLDDVVHGETEPDEPADAVEGADDLHDPDVMTKASTIVRTPGPWSWPLAEPDEEPHAAGTPAGSPDESPGEPDAPEPQAAAVAVPDRVGNEAAPESDVEAGFFHRDEPVGSQYVDFDEVRNELVQIGIVWLGETNAVQVTQLLSSTRSTIDDFVATIDTIRGLHVDGQDSASIQAMAREMHQQAAERLCGA